MPRPRKPRCCRLYEGDRVFKPRSVPMTALAAIPLALDELEALRLCDLEGETQAAAGVRIGVSRGTVQRLVKSARRKVVLALTQPAALVIQTGEDDEDLPADA